MSHDPTVGRPDTRPVRPSDDDGVARLLVNAASVEEEASRIPGDNRRSIRRRLWRVLDGRWEGDFLRCVHSWTATAARCAELRAVSEHTTLRRGVELPRPCLGGRRTLQWPGGRRRLATCAHCPTGRSGSRICMSGVGSRRRVRSPGVSRRREQQGRRAPADTGSRQPAVRRVHRASTSVRGTIAVLRTVARHAVRGRASTDISSA